jgi:hypothetical protein
MTVRLLKGPRRRHSSGVVGSSKAVAAWVWVQAPPRQWWRDLTMAGLDLVPTDIDLGSGVFLFLKIDFWCRLI